jgi:Ti-type conjugative transfer relaxase TraA
MNPRINVGRGVTGAVRYVLGQGRDPKTGVLKELMPGDDSRVEWIGGTGFGFKIETAADADLARRVMEFDALNQKSRTKQCQLDCVHLSLSWRPGETPSREQMEEAARSALAELGMGNAKAIFVAHNDEDFSHTHIVASKINPDTGRAYDLERSYRKLSVWAQEYEREHGGVISLRRQDANELRAAIAKRDAAAVLDALTKQRATFTGAQLERAINKEIYAKRGSTADEKLRVERERAGFAASVINHPRAVHLAETKDGPTVRYTTREVIEAELHVLRAAEGLVLDNTHQLDDHQRTPVLQSEQFKSITSEQAKAFHHATGAEGLALIDGQAGTGKSFTIAAIRSAYEAAGYRVIGLGPTNSVAQDMKADGFGRAATIHSELFALNNNRTGWTQKTAVIVDEAAMLDTKLMAMVTAHAHDAGAKLILVGDDRQLSSIDRAGMFGALKDRYGAAALSEVKRQHKIDERRAAEMMADGNFHDALGIYQAKGAIHWTRTQREARAELVEQWAKDSSADPDKSRFVFAYTNEDVRLLNAALRDVRKGRGELGPDHMFETAHGRENFSAGDRIQFTKTDKKAGIFNGAAGTIEAIDGCHLAVRLDGRETKTISFNAAAFNEFRHGYAGTIYRGQGRTLDQTMLYHSEHWRSAASYVALTRHRDKAELFVATNTARDVKELARQMARTDDRRAASQFYHRQDIQVRPLAPAEMLASFAAGIFRDRAETAQEPAAGEAKGNAQATHLHANRAAPCGGDEIPPRKDRKMEDERDSNPRRPANANNVGVTTSELAHGDSGLRRRPADLRPEPDFSKAAFDTTEPDTKLREAWRQPEFSEATIAADPWTAVYLAIPENAKPWLLLKAIDATAQCQDMIVRGSGTGPQLQQGDHGPIDNARQATERFHELSHRLEAALKPEMTPPSAPPPTTPQRANDNTRERMTVEAIQQDPWKVLDRPLPADADRTLLASGRRAYCRSMREDGLCSEPGCSNRGAGACEILPRPAGRGRRTKP